MDTYLSLLPQDISNHLWKFIFQDSLLRIGDLNWIEVENLEFNWETGKNEIKVKPVNCMCKCSDCHKDRISCKKDCHWKMLGNNMLNYIAPKIFSITAGMSSEKFQELRYETW
ncbi:MAG TPA: hypothetical protein VK590_02025 [Saprospiraceae bacterium]|nr:hypothetical protein [Saprospiraceae bacterium]